MHARWVRGANIRNPPGVAGRLDYFLIFGAVLALHALPSFAGAMSHFEPGPQLSREQACVARNAKVGDVIENINGDQLVIRSLAPGLANLLSPCGGPENSVLAEVAFIESPQFHSTVTMDLPTDFARRDLSNRDRFDLYRVRATDKYHKIYLWVKSWDRRKVADPKAFVDEQRRAQALLGPITQAPVEGLTIQGVPAMHWEAQHKPRFLAPNTTYFTTVLIGHSEVAVLTVWGSSRWFAPTHDQQLQIADSIHGLSEVAREASAAVISPAR